MRTARKLETGDKSETIKIRERKRGGLTEEADIFPAGTADGNDHDFIGSGVNNGIDLADELHGQRRFQIEFEDAELDADAVIEA